MAKGGPVAGLGAGIGEFLFSESLYYDLKILFKKSFLGQSSPYFATLMRIVKKAI
jgi:hypothetical protein